MCADRELLARVVQVKRAIGQAVPVLLEYLDDGRLPPHGLREIADRLDSVVDDLRQHADVLERSAESQLHEAPEERSAPWSVWVQPLAHLSGQVKVPVIGVLR